MSRFDADFSLALADTLYERGSEVIHTPRPPATTVTLLGVFDPMVGQNGQDLSNDRLNRNQLQTGVLIVGRTDTAGNAWAIDEDGTFTIDGIAWRIANVGLKPGGYYQIKLERHNRKTLNTVKDR